MLCVCRWGGVSMLPRLWSNPLHGADFCSVTRVCVLGVCCNSALRLACVQVIRSTEKIAEDFLKEISVLKECRSPHVVMVRLVSQALVSSLHSCMVVTPSPLVLLFLYSSRGTCVSRRLCSQPTFLNTRACEGRVLCSRGCGHGF